MKWMTGAGAATTPKQQCNEKTGTKDLANSKIVLANTVKSFQGKIRTNKSIT